MQHVLRSYDIVKTDFIRGQGCNLYDSRGDRYIDFEAGVWCVGLGHNHPRVNRVLLKQIEKLTHIGYRYTPDLVEEAAIALSGTWHDATGKCVFLNSGSEAVEFGVRVARLLSEKPLLLTMSDSYLAAYGSAGSKDETEWYCFDWQLCEREGCDSDCRHIQEIPFDQIGGFVFEPGNAHGTVRFPPSQIVQAITDRIKQQHGFVVVDEVTTGLGRTGAWYGYDHYGLQPDIVAVGKGLGNGYPVSAVMITRDLADRVEHSGLRYAQSHQNDPPGCAVAREVIAVLREEDLIERSRQIGEYFLAELNKLAKRHSAIKEVRGRGLMIVVEFHDSGESDTVTRLYQQLLSNGVIVGYTPPAHLLRFYPPLTIEKEDIMQLVHWLDHFIT